MDDHELLVKILTNQCVIYRELQKVKDLLKKRSTIKSDLAYIKELHKEASGFIPHINQKL